MVEEIVKKLKDIGFDEYEALTYAILLKREKATVQEIMDGGNLPKASIYDVLRVLQNRKFIEIIPGKPTYYRAISPEEFMRNRDQVFIQKVQDELGRIRNSHDTISEKQKEDVYDNDHDIFSAINALFESAEHKVVIFSTDPVFLEQFSDHLVRLNNRCFIIIIGNNPDAYTSFKVRFRENNPEIFRLMEDIPLNGNMYHHVLTLFVDEKISFDVRIQGGRMIGMTIPFPVYTNYLRLWLSFINPLEENGLV